MVPGYAVPIANPLSPNIHSVVFGVCATLRLTPKRLLATAVTASTSCSFLIADAKP